MVMQPPNPAGDGIGAMMGVPPGVPPMPAKKGRKHHKGGKKKGHRKGGHKKGY